MKRIVFFIPCLFFLKLATAQPANYHLADSIPVIVGGVTLNNPWAGGINFPIFSEIDLNGDGIHDLFFYDRGNARISTFINDGTSGVKAWHYAPEYASKFPPINRWVRLYDYNCDGKVDFFTLSPGNNGIAVYRNDFDAVTGLHFTLITPSVKDTEYSQSFEIYADAVSLPAFADVDGDGDMDIVNYTPLTSQGDGFLQYNRNYSMEYYGVCDSLAFKVASEKWGNFEICVGCGGAQISCFQCRQRNNPPREEFPDSPVKELEEYDQSTAARRDDTISGIFLLDNDGDGDQDVLIGDSGSTNTCLGVNGGTPDSAMMVSQDITYPSYDIPMNITYFDIHSYIDLDNDSIRDMIAAPTALENYRGMWFYKNNGTDAHPVFHYESNSFLIDQMIDVGEGACPVLFDADADGLPDLIIGNYGIWQTNSYKTSLQYYRNTGTASAPSFTLDTDDYAGIGALGLTGPLFPAFADLDGDGDKDMILGSGNGRLIFFENTAGAGHPAIFGPPQLNYMHIKMGNSSTPQLIDLNRDGLADLVIGNKTGILKYFQNTGTASAAFFDSIPTVDTLGGIIAQANAYDGYSVPFVYDENGSYQMLVSCEDGHVVRYDQIDGNLYGNFNVVDTLFSGSQGSHVGFNLAVGGGDLNNDSLADFLLGIYSGGVQIYLQEHPTVAVKELTTVVAPHFVLASNPADGNCLVRFFNLSPGKNQLDIINEIGQVVFSEPVHADKIYLDTHILPAGIYLIRVTSSLSSVSEKLVVKH